MYLKVYRHELKYFINYKEYLLLKQLFDVLMERDTHCEDHGYWIRSMYFDSYFQDDYYEKVVGVENRKKLD